MLALDAGSGTPKWAFTVGGPVDSPPTIHGDAVLFGSADGHVYCLRLDDGVLAWQLRAAPMERQTVALGRIESLWPVHGSTVLPLLLPGVILWPNDWCVEFVLIRNPVAARLWLERR